MFRSFQGLYATVMRICVLFSFYLIDVPFVRPVWKNGKFFDYNINTTIRTMLKYIKSYIHTILHTYNTYNATYNATRHCKHHKTEENNSIGIAAGYLFKGVDSYGALGA